MSARPRILVVDDRPNMLRLVQKILRDGLVNGLVNGAEVLCAEHGSAAIELLEREPVAVVLCDLKMREVDGLEVLAASKRLQPGAVFVLMTAYATVETAIQAMRMGAYDYLAKPFEPADLRAVVSRALGRAELELAASDHHALLPGIYGRTPEMAELAAMVRRIAPTDATALILGETGTGKERVARALHQLSSRAARRFVAVNCAAIPGELLESELFGHSKGAFTGAGRERAGLFEDADGGSVFLDEIGDMQASLQAKLTRVLEERSIRRLGETRERAVDVRLIAATHRDIEGMVAAGTFRDDLWYRLNVTTLRLPALRDHIDDVELLARRFLAEEADKRAGVPREFSQAALDLLRGCAWPGNVRQLRAAVERASILARRPMIDVDDLPPDLRTHPVFDPALGDDGELVELNWQQAIDRARDRLAPRYLAAVLSAEQGNVAAAAARAGIERESFYRLLRKYGVRAGEFR